MEEIQNKNEDTQADAAVNSAGEGGTDVENKSIKDVLNKTLNREFKTDEDALKAVKSAQDMIGKREEDVRKEVKEELTTKDKSSEDVLAKIASLEKQVKHNSFYTENPDYKPYADLISRYGENPAEVVEDDKFKAVFGPLKAQIDSDQSKSVLMKNPRLGKANDKIEKAKELLAKGDDSAAREEAVKGVLDAYES